MNGEAFNFGPPAHVNQTVAELLSAMVERWPEAAWNVPEGSEHGGHEAKLLKLSCDKALYHLSWRAVMEFPETVAFTVDWYRAWHSGAADLHGYTVGQIDEYCRLARERSIVWTVG